MTKFKTPKGTEIPLLNLHGKDYLQVCHRLVWFREEKPDWSIETFPVELKEESTMFKAEIKDPSGRTIATAHKYEDKKGFADHKEKAETGAVGRALAMVGYGTQFAPEFDEGARIVDAPIGRDRGNVYPEQPEEGNGVFDDSYRIPFGKFVKRALEDVGPKELSSYINYLESKALKDGKPIQGMVKDFIDRASQYIASWENQPHVQS